MSALPRCSIVALLLLLGGLAVSPLQAQPTDVPLTAERRPAEVGMAPAFFRVSESGNTLEQWSSHLWISVPAGARTQLWAQSRLAGASATGRRSLDGWGDTQAGATAAWSLASGSLVGSLRLNIPSGRQAVRPDQLETSILLGQPAFGADVANLGQGWNVTPGLTWAVPLGDRLMLGIGGSFRYLGGYTPLDDAPEKYTPGNEILLNAGLDVRLQPETAVSLDVAYTRYGADEFDGAEAVETGARWTLTSQVRTVLGRQTDLRVLARYTGQGQSTLPPPPNSVLPAEDVQTLPQSVLGRVDARVPFGRTVRLAVHTEGARYDATATTLGGDWDLASSRRLLRVGGGPDVRLGDAIFWRPELSYTTGSFSRITARFSLYWRQ